MEEKYIVINLRSGFGNKLYDAFISLYIKEKFGHNIYFVLNHSKHDKLNDPFVSEVYPLLKNEIHFIYENEFKFKKYNTLQKISPNMKELHILKNINKVNFITWGLYSNIKNIYKYISKKYNKLFIFNTKLIKSTFLKNYITNNSINIYNPYAVIHIRYGDKLYFSNKRFQKNIFKYLLNTPSYYFEQIQYLKNINSNMPIFIVTDSYLLVKKFIIEKYNLQNDKNIIFIDLPFIYSYYLLLNATYMVLSNSTFAFTAYMLSNKYKKAIFSSLKLEECIKYGVADPFVLNSNNKNSKDKNIMIYNKKYILNYNQKLLNIMYNYNEKLKIKN
jgi:hypothetical protein